MAGWRLHFLLFPTVMVNMILANILFLQLKRLLLTPKQPLPPPPPPPTAQQPNPPYRDNADNQGQGQGPTQVHGHAIHPIPGLTPPPQTEGDAPQRNSWFRVNSSFF